MCRPRPWNDAQRSSCARRGHGQRRRAAAAGGRLPVGPGGRRAVGWLETSGSSLVRSFILAAAAFLSQGCFSGRYLAQAARGQFEIVRNARPIPDVIADGDAPAKVRRLLAAVDAIKRFGRAQGLRPTASYE